jgi:membrane-bound ClpP family serine protease
MWVIAGILLGLVVFVSLTGFHVGPHAHMVAGVLGLLTAAWFVAMAADGRAVPVLWVLLGADVAVSAGVALLASKGLSSRRLDVSPHHGLPPEAAEGVAVCDLDPAGIVRVGGETWSAVALNGNVPSGTPVQVVRIRGVRLEVWGEETVDSLSAASRPPELPSERRQP